MKNLHNHDSFIIAVKQTSQSKKLIMNENLHTPDSFIIAINKLLKKRNLSSSIYISVRWVESHENNLDERKLAYLTVYYCRQQTSQEVKLIMNENLHIPLTVLLLPSTNFKVSINLS
jgi:hypothetical protein